jgi:hypothetical protein
VKLWRTVNSPAVSILYNVTAAPNALRASAKQRRTVEVAVGIQRKAYRRFPVRPSETVQQGLRPSSVGVGRQLENGPAAKQEARAIQSGLVAASHRSPIEVAFCILDQIPPGLQAVLRLPFEVMNNLVVTFLVDAKHDAALVRPQAAITRAPFKRHPIEKSRGRTQQPGSGK